MKLNNWKKKFNKKFFIEDGEISVENIVELECFIQDLLEKQKQKFTKMVKGMKLTTFHSITPHWQDYNLALEEILKVIAKI